MQLLCYLYYLRPSIATKQLTVFELLATFSLSASSLSCPKFGFHNNQIYKCTMSYLVEF